jgi:hypothetical protein
MTSVACEASSCKVEFKLMYVYPLLVVSNRLHIFSGVSAVCVVGSFCARGDG